MFRTAVASHKSRLATARCECALNADDVADLPPASGLLPVGWLADLVGWLAMPRAPFSCVGWQKVVIVANFEHHSLTRPTDGQEFPLMCKQAAATAVTAATAVAAASQDLTTLSRADRLPARTVFTFIVQLKATEAAKVELPVRHSPFT